MEQLRFAAVHEDGQHLVLSTPDGAEVLLPIDARLRAALRTRSAPADAPATPLSPRNVQAMIRAGQSPQEVAEITGWPQDRVARFEGPILAEREHISGMAQAAHVRGRSAEGGVPTLGARVLERLAERGVDTDNIGWDATRPEGGPWTVVVSFVAGQRQRAAAWRFEPLDRTVEALDDEARWLSEDEQALPGVAGVTGGTSRRAPRPDKPARTSRGSTGEVELMTSMRERSRSRGRRKKVSTSSSDPAGLPQLEHAPEDVLPLENLSYDPDTMGLPPAAHGESPAPEAASQAEAEDSGTAPTEEAADRGNGAAGPGVHDVPLEFDNDGPDIGGAEAGPDDSDLGGAELDDSSADEDEGPREATLDDIFGPEGEDEDDEDLDTDPDSEPAEDSAAEEEADLDSELGVDAIDEDAAELGGDLEGDEVSGPDERPDAAAAESKPEPEGQDVAEDSVEITADDSEEAAEEPQDEPAPEKAPKTSKRRKDGRPGVPSWDDIMFGAKDRRG